MRLVQHLRLLLALGLISFVFTLPIACTSSDSGVTSGDDYGSGGGGSTHGNVAVFMTDGPSDYFAAVNVTVTQIDLLSESGHVTLTSNEMPPFDLLELQNFSHLISFTSEITPGEYTKLRLTISKLELVLHGGGKIYPDLPGGGTLDLVPRNPFDVQLGATLTVEIDIDVNKSIHVVDLGNGGYIFRPVVFVTVGSEAPSKLVRLFGYVDNTPQNLDDMIKLCPVDIADSGIQNIFCESANLVALASNGSVFGPDGRPGNYLDLGAEQLATVIGAFSDIHQGIFEAAVIERIGWVPPGDFKTLAGNNVTGVALGSFDFALHAGETATDDPIVSVQLQDGTKVFSATGDPLDTTDIVDGLDAEIDGVLDASSSTPDILRSALVVLDTSTSQQQQLSGIIGTAGADMMVETNDGSACLRLPADAQVQLITESTTNVTSEPGNILDLRFGRYIDAYGSTSGECFEAQEVVVFVSG